MDNEKYGLLLQPDIKIYRKYFNEMIRLIGITVIYRAVKPNKHWTTYGEIESNYESPMSVGCIFTEHPDQKTMKKLGWVAELQGEASLIHVPYDLPNIQVGALFVVPSGIDSSVGRLFRVVEMQNSIIYPASITCKIVPEYEDVYDKSLDDFTNDRFNVIVEEEFED